MTSLSLLCPDLARTETLSIEVTQPDLPLPPGTYHFHELYCPTPGCDCRRVLFDVVAGDDAEPLARIHYTWEDPEYYSQWLEIGAEEGRAAAGVELDPMLDQSPIAPALETALREKLAANPEIVERIRAHYTEFKRRLEENPLPVQFAAAPSTPMSVPEILERLEYLPDPATFQDYEEAIESAIQQQEAVTPDLLRSIEAVAADPDSFLADNTQSLHLFALCLLAQFRETRALEPILRLFSLPEDLPLDLTEDIILDSGGQILASVAGGNPRPLLELAINPAIHEAVRDEAILGLLIQHAWGERTREELVNDLREVAAHLRPDTHPSIGDGFITSVRDLHLTELLPEVREIFSKGCLDPEMVGDLRMVEAELTKAPTDPEYSLTPEQRLADFKERFGPIDALEECSLWLRFQKEDWDFLDELDDLAPRDLESSHRPVIDVAPAPYVAPPTVGRNDPCPCGSGKKFKKCCG